MADIINLNQKRKAQVRAAKEKEASQNRVKFGRTKKEKLTEKQKAEKLEQHVEGHKRENDKSLDASKDDHEEE